MLLNWENSSQNDKHFFSFWRSKKTRQNWQWKNSAIFLSLSIFAVSYKFSGFWTRNNEIRELLCALNFLVFLHQTVQRSFSQLFLKIFVDVRFFFRCRWFITAVWSILFFRLFAAFLVFLGLASLLFFLWIVRHRSIARLLLPFLRFFWCHTFNIAGVNRWSLARLPVIFLVNFRRFQWFFFNRRVFWRFVVAGCTAAAFFVTIRRFLHVRCIFLWRHIIFPFVGLEEWRGCAWWRRCGTDGDFLVAWFFSRLTTHCCFLERDFLLRNFYLIFTLLLVVCTVAGFLLAFLVLLFRWLVFSILRNIFELWLFASLFRFTNFV